MCSAVLCCAVLCRALLCSPLLCFAVLYLFSVWPLLYIPNNTSSRFQTVFGTGSAWANCLPFFAFLRFWAGVATAGYLLVRFVYCMELSLTSNKTIVGYVNKTFVTVGFTTLSLFAYLIRDWRYLLTTLSIINVPLLLFWKWVQIQLKPGFHIVVSVVSVVSVMWNKPLQRKHNSYDS